MNKKKIFGEIFTPVELINKMLDTLPAHVWSNPNLKWLDPCAGHANFPLIILQRLMDGLQDEIKDVEERKQHILSKMLFLSELQPESAQICSDKEFNVYCGSYLDEGFNNHTKNVWGVEKFDIIVANPPYNEELINGRSTGSKSLWDKFVIKTLEQLNEAGFLVAVHPSGWRNVDGRFKKVQEKLRKRQILSLEVHDEGDGQKTFGATTAYDFYCLQNVEPNVFTKIVCLDGTIERADISQMEFIPNGMFDMFLNLLSNGGQETVNVIGNSSYHTQRPHMLKEQTDEFKYPCIANVTLKGKLSCIWYSNVNNKGFFGIPKVIFGRRRSGVFLDLNGDFGLTQDTYGIVDEPKNFPFIQRAMLNPEFIKLMHNANFANIRYNNKVIAMFRKNFWEEFQP